MFGSLELMRFGESPSFSLSVPTEPTEWPETEIADAEVTRVARAIRLHYYRQIPLLRQIPYFALEANGHGGWLDEYQRAYRECLMALHQENETWGSFDMLIELRTGVLIAIEGSESHYIFVDGQKFEFGGETKLHLANDKEVYNILAHQRPKHRFNPSEEIKYMQKMMLRPYHNDPEELEAALKDKVMYKAGLDVMMALLPEEQAIETLRAQGFDL